MDELLGRFWTKVRVGHPDDCWPWLAFVTRAGYGRFRWQGIAETQPHRFIYERLVGPIPDGWQVDHTCHDPRECTNRLAGCQHRRCVNPAHLEAVLPRINVLRSGNNAAQNARKTHCPKGHPLSGPNLLVVGGKRRCATCRRPQSVRATRAYKLRKRAAVSA